MTFEGIVAVGLLTRHDVDVLGPGFNSLWTVDETPAFSGLLRAIDEAEQKLRHDAEQRRH
jgi:hypothetical protein